MTIRRWIALALAGCMLSVSALAEVQSPTDLPPVQRSSAEYTPVPTEEPAVEPTEEPTDAPTEPPAEEPADTPTETPTEAPAEEPAAAPTEESVEQPWDESLCDHANENCVQAPACEDPACAHIGQDAHGLDVPLCAKGRWLLDRQDALG